MSERVIEEQIQYCRRRPAELTATGRLDALGWDCELEVDGEDWVIGRGRPPE